ncbi:hypothetical protein ACHAWF_003926, partial [Thalassiosira exigua]
MEPLSIADHNPKAAVEESHSAFEAAMARLDDKENHLKERLRQLNQTMFDPSQANLDAADDDLMEVNAGGKVIAAKRSTLTQLKGTRLESLFSGRWDKALQRDGNGHIFLDVNPKCFGAIDNPPSPPVVGDEEEHILRSRLDVFGLYSPKMPDSNIVRNAKDVDCLRDWLEEDSLDGEFDLLYRSSRDVHNQGCTLTVIETTDGFVLGGYSNTVWTSGGGIHKPATEAFLFVLSGSDVRSPCKMNLKDVSDGHAVYHYAGYGPAFGGGCDAKVHGSNVELRFGKTYESVPHGRLTTPNKGLYTCFGIKEMEVFQVSGRPPPAQISLKARKILQEAPSMEPVSIFACSINQAINQKQESLLQAEAEINQLEESIKDEKRVVTTFASGDTKDVVTLNTLQVVDDSVLARQFDDTKWTQQGRANLRVGEWTSDDVTAWDRGIQGLQEDVGTMLKDQGVNGKELLALDIDGLLMLGIKQAGTLCLILKEITKLKKASTEFGTLIEHSPYCFGKILDHL